MRIAVDTQQRRGKDESKWPALIALIAVMGLQLATLRTFPHEVRTVVLWATLPTEGLLLLFLFSKIKQERHLASERRAVVVLSALVAVENVISAGVLIWRIIDGRHDDVTNNAVALLGTGAAIFFTNATVFAIWFWQLDRDGPSGRWEARTNPASSVPWHFLFTQDAADDGVRVKIHAQAWRPTFFDYFYVSVTNVVAFSPTDAMPLTKTAKAFMAVEALIALSTLAVVLARAVNVIKLYPM